MPSDLYDRQDHLEALAINQGSPVKPPYLKDLDWLNTSSIQKLTLATPNLTSLNGLTRMKQLESLDVDLKSVPAESVSAVSSLNHLGRLVLRNMGRKAKQPALDLSAFPELRTLEFDFERSSTSGLPSLNGCPELQDLTLNLRSTAAISEPPDLSDLKQLHFLKLFLDNSQVRSLRPLTTTDSLQTVTLSLDGTQLELLKDLDSSPGIPSLTLLLTSPPNDPLPDLSGIRELISLTLQMPGPRGSDLPDKTPIPDITYLGNLQALSLSLKGSEVRSLPDITRLNRLRIVDLDLEGSSVENLPEISKLQDLEELALNLNSTKIRELPNFAQSPTLFPKLTKLHLKLAHSKIKVLHDIEHLSDLNTLELDIRGTTVDDISSIAKFTKLENLTLYLDWSQVHDLPDLSPLKSLKVMELHISGWWATEQLPNLSNLPNLGKVKLVVEGSQIKDWSPVEHITNLQELELDLKGASTETLPDLNSLQKLSRVAVDLRHSGIKLSATRNLRALQELTIDKSFGSLEGLPKSLKKLALEP